MSLSAPEFAAALRGWAAATPGRARAVAADAFAHLVDAVVDDTPVAEGTARSGWVTTVGAPGTSPAVPDPTGEPAKTEARIVTAEWAAGDGREPLTLANTLPYVHRLEYEGWSQQAPQGMLRVNLTQWAALMRAAAARARAGEQSRDDAGRFTAAAAPPHAADG